MSRSNLSSIIAFLALVASMAAPAEAAPRRRYVKIGNVAIEGVGTLEVCRPARRRR